MRLSFARQTLTLARPFETSYGTVRERELLTVTLTDDAGAAGHGEAAPLPAYDGVTPARVQTALERHADALGRAGDRPDAELLERCRLADPLPAAIAAVDMALWDRAGRVQDTPVAALLCERPAGTIPVNATLAAVDPDAAAEQAARAREQGFRCLKVKVGTHEDKERLAAVRAAAGPGIALRLDANGAWSVREAVNVIRELGDGALELVEEPVHGVDAVREVRRQVAAPVSIDETAEQPGALGAGAADAVCLKVSRFGGISGVLAAATVVRSSGAEVYLASTLDGPLGIAAALHAAAALAASAPLRHCGLATLSLFAGLEETLPACNGAIELPSGAGLGVGAGLPSP